MLLYFLNLCLLGICSLLDSVFKNRQVATVQRRDRLSLVQVLLDNIVSQADFTLPLVVVCHLYELVAQLVRVTDQFGPAFVVLLELLFYLGV